MNRYIVMHERDARERKLPGFERELTEAEKRSWCGPDQHWSLWEVNDEGEPVRHVWSDGMEPEDAILVRDLKVLVEELNEVARERDDYREALKKAGG